MSIAVNERCDRIFFEKMQFIRGTKKPVNLNNVVDIFVETAKNFNKINDSTKEFCILFPAYT